MQHQTQTAILEAGQSRPAGRRDSRGGWPQWVVAIAVTRNRPTVRETGSGDVLQVESWSGPRRGSTVMTESRHARLPLGWRSRITRGIGEGTRERPRRLTMAESSNSTVRAPHDWQERAVERRLSNARAVRSCVARDSWRRHWSSSKNRASRFHRPGSCRSIQSESASVLSALRWKR